MKLYRLNTGKFNILFLLLILIGLFFWPLRLVKAQANNKFGIHVLETSDVQKAQELVNSSGGDWGYVTIVLREDDLNKDKWQRFMDDARRLHLIPIVRIATKMSGTFWTKPQMENLHIWPEFLNSLNWPVKEQIIVGFNEPNHAKEWGGEINPREYANTLDKLISLLKDANPNFYILNAGFDQAADGRNGTMDEGFFLSEMQKAQPDIFNKLDGWSSHSYPNHGFVGSPFDIGRRSIKGYEWELGVVEELGGTKELPVFITETGWPHSEGISEDSRFYKSSNITQLLDNAFLIWEKDDRVKSVTPFVLNYQADPFDHFSWIDNDAKNYEQFDTVKNLSKEKAEPEQVEKYSIEKIVVPDLLPTNYLYKGKLTIKNIGQWIMGERKDFKLELNPIVESLGFSGIILEKGDLIYPGQEKVFDFSIRTGSISATQDLEIAGKIYTIYIYKPFDWTNKKVSFWRQVQNRFKLWWLEWSNK